VLSGALYNGVGLCDTSAFFFELATIALQLFTCRTYETVSFGLPGKV